MKRFIRTFLIVSTAAVCLAAGALAAKKLYSMYGNLWTRLDTLYINQKDLSRELDGLGDQIRGLEQRLERMRRGNDVYDNGWTEKVPPYIAHACGGIDGKTYTNSLEAFEANYELGQRVFEVDFNLGEDGLLVVSHDEQTWREMTGAADPYTAGFVDLFPLYGQYEALSLEEVIALLEQYPDVYIVTDTKDQEQDRVMLAFAQLVHQAKKTAPEVLDRIIPQIYSEDMLSWISAIHPFRSVIYTLYATKWSPESVADFCMDSGVRFITMQFDKVTEEILRHWDTVGIQVAAHTVNDPEQAKELFEMGVDMIYTDFLTP